MFIFGLLIALGAAFWVRNDYRTLAAQGIRVGSMGETGWLAGVFLLLIVFLPLYFFQRSKALRTGPVGRYPGGFGYPPAPQFPPAPPAAPPVGPPYGYQPPAVPPTEPPYGYQPPPPPPASPERPAPPAPRPAHAGFAYCGNCGKALIDGARFCAACGTAVPAGRNA